MRVSLLGLIMILREILCPVREEGKSSPTNSRGKSRGKIRAKKNNAPFSGSFARRRRLSRGIGSLDSTFERDLSFENAKPILGT